MRYQNRLTIYSVVRENEAEPHNPLPSMTIPDMTLPLKELVQRYTRGQSVATLTPIYTEENDDLPDTSKMTKLEKIDALRAVAEEMSNIKADLQSKEAKKREQTEAQAREKAINDEVEKRTKKGGVTPESGEA